MKKLLFVLMLLIMSGCATMMGGDRTVNVTGDQIAKMLNDKFALPVELSKMLSVNLSNSVVTFDETTGRMTTTMDSLLSSNLIDKTVSGKLGISGKLRFDAATSAVVLDDAKVESVSLGENSQFNQLLSAMAQTVGSKMMQGLTLYKVKPDDLTYAGTQYNPKEMQVTGQGLKITLSPVR